MPTTLTVSEPLKEATLLKGNISGKKGFHCTRWLPQELKLCIMVHKKYRGHKLYVGIIKNYY